MEGASTASLDKMGLYLTTFTKKFSSYIPSIPILFQMKILVPCPVTRDPGRKTVSIFLISYFIEIKRVNLVSLCIFFSRLNKRTSLSLYSWPSSGPTLPSPPFSCDEDLELNAELQGESHQSRVKVQNPLCHPTGHAAFGAAQAPADFLGCKHTLLFHAPVFSYQCLQVLVFRTSHNPFTSQLILILGITPLR